jgi:alpha-galactosidase
MSDGSSAVIFYNTNFVYSVTLTLSWTQLGYAANSTMYVRDLWQHKTLGKFTSTFTTKINAVDVVMIRASMTPL